MQLRNSKRLVLHALRQFENFWRRHWQQKLTRYFWSKLSFQTMKTKTARIFGPLWLLGNPTHAVKPLSPVFLRFFKKQTVRWDLDWTNQVDCCSQNQPKLREKSRPLATASFFLPCVWEIPWDIRPWINRSLNILSLMLFYKLLTVQWWHFESR